MSLSRSIAKNVLLQYISRVIGTALGLVTLAILTRYLGDEGYGQFTVAASYLQFVGTLVDFGLTITTIRMLSEPGADGKRILGNLVTLRIVTAIAIFALSVGVAFLLPWGSMTHAAIAVGSFSFIFLSLHQVFVGVFQKSLRMEFPAVAEVVGRAGLLLGVAAVAYWGGNLISVMAAMGAGNLAMLFISSRYARRIQPFRFGLDWEIIRQIVRRSWPIALSIIFNLVYLRGDVIVMKIIGRADAEIGWYGAAYKPLDVITVIPIIFMGLVLPIFVQAWEKRDDERVKRIIQRALDAVGILAFPTLAGGIVLASPLMLFISGPEYAPSGPLLAVLVVAAFMVFYGSLFGHLIVGINRQRLMTWAYAVNAAISLGLYLMFIPRFGATAAAWVTVFSEAVVAITAGAIVLSVSAVRPRLIITLKAIAASAMMGLVIYAIPSVHVLLRMLIGIAAYAALMIALRAITKKELKDMIGIKAQG
jgi:O-antigen/teichoic acid export membrane protein